MGKGVARGRRSDRTNTDNRWDTECLAQTWRARPKGVDRLASHWLAFNSGAGNRHWSSQDFSGHSF